MQFLGIDPGYGRIGYALIANCAKNRLQPLDWGVLETDAKLNHPQRLLQLQTMLDELLKRYSEKEKIFAAAVEEVFFRKNLTTGVKLLQARGVILCTLAVRKITVVEITPTELKKMISGNGNAKKDIVKLMVTRLLSLPQQSFQKTAEQKSLPDDAYDALALAVSAWMQYKSGMLAKNLNIIEKG